MYTFQTDETTSVDVKSYSQENTTSTKESDETTSKSTPESETRSHSDQSSISSLNENDKDEQLSENKNRDVKYCSSYYYNHRNRILVGFIFIAIIIFIIVDTQTNNYVKNGLQIVMDWICDNPYMGIFVYTLICFVATVLFIPGLFITLGGAFIFACSFSYVAGILIASTCVFIGASLGAVVSFMIGRYLLRNCAKKFARKFKMLEAIDSALCCKGLRIMFLLRLSPVIPFNVLNYFAGVTAMTFRDNTISLLGILPGTILFVFVGASAGKITETSMTMDNTSSSLLTIICVSIGIVFALFGVAATTFYAKKELNKVRISYFTLRIVLSCL